MEQKMSVIGLGQMGTIYLKVAINELGISPQNIVVYDVVPEKMVRAVEDFGVTAVESVADAAQGTAIVTTNTPSHVHVMKELVANGTKQIFCEKPLGMTSAEVARLSDLGAEIFTAFLINFSPALAKVVEVMRDNDLVLREGSATWGKNRFGNNRPTPGDLEDEMVHAVQVFQMLASVNMAVVRTEVCAHLTYLDYVNHHVQAEARRTDPSFPDVEDVNSSSNILMQLALSDRYQDDVNLNAPVTLRSSYVMAKQVRTVEGVLSYNPSLSGANQPVYAFHIDFDVRGSDGVKDVLTLTKSDVNIVQEHPFASNKIALELGAFFAHVRGEGTDPRLTGLSTAQRAVAFSDAAKASSAKKGEKVTV